MMSPQIKQRASAWWRRVFLVLELCGVTVILWHGVPIYRELLAGDFNRAQPLVKLWATGATALIQIGYWLRYLPQASPSLPRQVFIGHVLMFLARLNLIFTGGDAKYFGVTMPKEIAMTTTERAYTSPIWYTP